MPAVPAVIPPSSIITRDGGYGVKDVRKITGHFKGPGSPSSEYLRPNGSLFIKLFELSTSARTASQEVHLSYKTTLREFDILRRVLVEDLAKTDDILKGELEADEAYFGGKRKGNRGGEESEERLNRAPRQVERIRFSHVLWL